MIALHHRPGSFSDKWIEYCDQHGISYKLVDCYGSDIIDQVKDCQGLMWHWGHHDYKAVLFARQLTYSLEMMGKKVFPDSNTCWHYDDKLGQKYLLEVIGAPLVPTYVFYDKKQALKWAETATYPKVFKLRGGASSENVKLVPDYDTASQLIKKAFGKGFKSRDRLNYLKERLWHFKRDKNLESLMNVSKGIGRLFIPTQAEIHLPVERDYVYFQDFIPNNDHDIRIITIGSRAFAIKRMTRKGDFRASGSGQIIYDPEKIPKACIKKAFSISGKLRAQCMTYDFLFQEGEPRLVEISYAFSAKAYLPCPGFWHKNLRWKGDNPGLECFMIEDFLKSLQKNES